MNILKDVLAELFKMFVGDARLTGAILGIVAIAAALVRGTALPTLVGGCVLLAGCIAVLLLSVRREARRRGGPPSAKP
jgi:hypothetical protein